MINLPSGGSVTLRYDFERVQKRCYHCQRLTHEKDKCPILIQERKDKAAERRKKMVVEKQKKELILPPEDPLFGVLSEEKVGVNGSTGRRKISPEVLQNMREYLLAAEGGEKRVREERVRSSILGLLNDPAGQRSFLRLDALPLVISDVDKDKGLTFDYGLKNMENRVFERRVEGNRREPASTVSAPIRGVLQDSAYSKEFYECSRVLTLALQRLTLPGLQNSKEAGGSGHLRG